MSLPVTFGPLSAATMAQLDQNFAAVGALGVIPCTVSGTNTLTFTPAANTPTISAYADFLRITGVITVSNSGAVTARVGALASLNVYVDTLTGPVALSAASTLIANNAVTLSYDSALNGGAGGWHLVSMMPVSAFLDLITSSTGAMLYRTSVSWTGLSIGSQGQVLRTDTSIPQWASVTTILDAALGSSVGMIAHRTSVGWSGLQPGASGTQLTSQGPGSVLVWT